MFLIFFEAQKYIIMYGRTSAQKFLFFLAIILFSQSCKLDPEVSSKTTDIESSITVVSRLVGEPNMLNPALTNQANSRRV